MVSAVGGYATDVSYGWETTFGTISSGFDKAFGQGVKLSTFNMDNTNDQVYQVGSQELQRQYAKEFKGSFSVDFLLSDPWFLRAILGAAPTTTGSGPYTHTYNTTNGINEVQTSFSMNVADDLDTDSDKNLLGCIANSMTLTASVGEPVRVKLDGAFANLSKDTGLTSAVAAVEEPLYFQQATLELPSGTTMPEVQSFEITVNRNNEFVWGLGSRFAQKNVSKQREYTMSMDMAYEQDSDVLDDFLGSTTAPTAVPTEAATLVLTVTNGESGTDERSYTITFANVMVETVDSSRAPEEVIRLVASMRARSLTSIVVVNNTASPL